MKIISLTCAILFQILVLVLTTPWIASSTTTHEDFLQCLESNSHHFSSKPQVYVPKTVAYSSILESSINNLRFTTPTTSKPQFIITPNHESHVQALVICSKKHGLQIRVRSGGHDFEGLSYTSNVPFVLIDLINLRTIDVNIKEDSAWVQAGATLGEVYYRIAEKSPVHGFPGGACPTVGSGGHISGGGFGALVRKYGMAAEYVLDARLVNAEGEILNRETMGEDLFWAIRGGGVASFGVLLAWKIKLVPVPKVVTVSMIDRTLEQGATDLVHKWQSVASYEVPRDVFIALHVTVVDKNATRREGSSRTVRVTFQVLYLGTSEKLLQLMEDKFPELGMKKKDCREMSWIKSTISFAGFPNETPINSLLNRSSLPKTTFKAKSDFVTKPISKAGLEGIWKRFLKEERPELLIAPWGGRVNEISEHKIPFPHRAGNMYLIDYVSNWDNKEGIQGSEKHISWIRELHDYMTPYVSKSPRAAFFNYKDLDLGKSKLNATSTHSDARIWGHMYFKSNFEKLVKVKSKVDPTSFFTNEQSIPTLASLHGRKKRF
ncbi:hypothetical protein Sjap_006354 [Stephania japonica]|uniref:FAD-binding PCMH-type domain-containing protein n=1 Tax=Stephania japonica TaxID=461633 RepID=A0AAP0K5V0_9MAGN